MMRILIASKFYTPTLGVGLAMLGSAYQKRGTIMVKGMVEKMRMIYEKI